MKNKSLLFLLLLITSFITAQNENEFLPFKILSNQIHFNLNSIAIERVGVLPEFYIHAVIYKQEETTYIVCYNQRRTTLDFVDLNTLKYAGAIDLKSIKEFDIDQPILSYSISGNNLVVFQSEKLSQFTLNGVHATFMRAVSINNDNGIFSTNTFNADLGFKPAIDADGAIYLMNLSYDAMVNEPAFYKVNNEVKINIAGNNLQTQFMPVSYPEIYSENYFGYYMMPKRVINIEGIHVFGYSSSPVLHTWNPQTNETQNFIARSSYQKEEIQSLDASSINDTKLLMNYTVSAGVYTSLIYDSYRNVYYRFYRPEIKEGVDCNACSYQDKPLVIMVLDSKLNILDELYIQKPLYEEQSSFVGSKGLYLSCANVNNKDFGKGYISYDILSFDNSKQISKSSTQINLKLVNNDDVSFSVAGEWDTNNNAVLSVFDLTGKLMLRDIYYSGKIINLPNVSSGIYMIQVSDAENKTILKWLKK